MSTMSADEASHWDELHMDYHVDRVNLSGIYSDRYSSVVDAIRKEVSGGNK